MGRRKLDQDQPKQYQIRPARTPEARENNLVGMAWDRLEERVANGTATAGELLAIMKLGTRKERLERELTEKKMELMQAKTEALQSAKKVEELYGEAIAAFKRYNGVFDEGEEDDDDSDVF